MIVRCMSILSPMGDELTEHDAIAIGEQYVVLTLYASPGHDVMLRVYGVRPEVRDPHPSPPALWRSQMFAVLSDEIPSNWRVAIASSGALRLEPETWLRPGFWEDLDEWTRTSEAARRDYEYELSIILREANVALETGA